MVAITQIRDLSIQFLIIFSHIPRINSDNDCQILLFFWSRLWLYISLFPMFYNLQSFKTLIRIKNYCKIKYKSSFPRRIRGFLKKALGSPINEHQIYFCVFLVFGWRVPFTISLNHFFFFFYFWKCISYTFRETII